MITLILRHNVRRGSAHSAYPRQGKREPSGACAAPRSHTQMISSSSTRDTGQEIAAFTSSATFFSTAGLHFCSAYDTGHRSPSSRFAASWKPRVEYR